MVRTPLFVGTLPAWLPPYHPRLLALAVVVGLTTGATSNLARRRGYPVVVVPAVAAAALAVGQHVMSVAEGATLAAGAVAVVVVTAAVDRAGPIRRRPGGPAVAAPDTAGGFGDRILAVAGAVSLVGVWAGVPDTEGPILVGGTVAIALVTAVGGGGRRPVRGADRVVLAGVVAAAAWAGARHHPALSGGVACVGLVPIVGSRWRSRTGELAVLVTHVAVVAVVSRVVTGWPPGASVPWLGATAVVTVAALVAERGSPVRIRSGAPPERRGRHRSGGPPLPPR